MNGDTENTSRTEKACELLESLNNYTKLTPPKGMNTNGLMSRLYDIQMDMANLVENIVSDSITNEDKQKYLAFGKVNDGYNSDSAIYGGVLENKRGKKIGEFTYNSTTGKVNYYNLAMLEKVRTEHTAYFNPTLVVTPPMVFNEMCKKVMSIKDDSDRLFIRPMVEEEKEEIYECFKDIYYYPDELETEAFLTHTMNKNYVSPNIEEDIKENIKKVNETYKSYKDKSEENDNPFERPKY